LVADAHAGLMLLKKIICYGLQKIQRSAASILWAGRLITISDAKFPASRQAI
jgi:hypothetical protein